MTALATLAASAWLALPAGTALASEIGISVVLDGFYTSGESALSERGTGFGLGHTELSLHAPVDDLFTGRLTTVLESHGGATELELEEAFLDTVALPFGLGVRAGRFLSQVGYLNARHTHADSFAERPAVYRALLGTHYFDDGARLDALLATPFFWRIGVEAFEGASLAGGEEDDDVGVVTLKSTWGGDLSASSSWQAGVSYLRHRLDVTAEAEPDKTARTDGAGGAPGDEHGHAHSHDAAYSGENLYVLDAIWKWAPRGNARARQLAVSGEYLYVDELGENAAEGDAHEGWYAAAVYRFGPQWSAGVRHGEVDLRQAHGDHFHGQSLRETDLMLTWARSHFSQLRLQVSLQDADGLTDANDTLTLQYVMTLGAHGAHAF